MSFFDFSSIVDTIKLLGPQITRQIGYVKNLERNVKELEEKKNELDSRRLDIAYKIEGKKDKKVTNEYQNWQKNVNEIDMMAKEVLQEFAKVDKGCLKRSCFDIRSIWNLGRRIVRTTKRISELIANNPSEFLVDEHPPRVEKIPFMPIDVGTSTYSTLEDILKLIKNEKIFCVGIWGMAGIGKTTMMKNLQFSSEIDGKFDIVIWITFGQSFSIRDMQNQIARRLWSKDLDNDEPNEIRAGKLYSELSCKNFLLLMDDLWDKIDFDEIGIPCRNQGNRSKVILTTRYLDVCNVMETDEEMMLRPLSEEESWKLFCEKVGDVIDFNDIRPLAKLIVKECGGLPLAIIVIGSSLRKVKRVQIWHDAVYKLSHPEKQRQFGYGLKERVYAQLEFGVDRLESENLKKCFLYVALYPEDVVIQISQLIEYWRVEGFLDSTYKLVEARNEGHTFLKRLVDSSLLIDWDNDTVKMHDLLRDLAFEIMSRDSSNKFLARVGEKTSLEIHQWTIATMISLRYEQKLPDVPINCPSLKTLHLNYNLTFEMIVPRFFNHMESLRVLDLSFTRIKSLPPSIASLVSLVGLYLRNCRMLMTLPPEIGNLQKLEVLDLWWTYLFVLPTEVSQLTHLRVLQFGLFLEGGAMSIGIISRLQKLEQLCIYLRNDSQWVKWENYAELVNEVYSLNELTCLEFPFKDIEYLKHFMETSGRWRAGAIKTFRFSIGKGDTVSMDISYGPYCIEKGLSVVSVPDGNALDIPCELLRRTNALNAENDDTITSLSEVGLQNLSNLITCNLSSCLAMKIIFSISNADGAEGENVLLPSLEYLFISYMGNLRGIWDGRFPKGSFARLKELKIFICLNLKHLLSFEICQHLCTLEKIHICCGRLEELISVGQFGESRHHSVLLPKLKYLRLQSLKKLVVILRGDFLPNWPSLERIDVLGCKKLKKLPLGLSNAPRLRKITCQKYWWDRLTWSNEAIKLKLESHICLID